MYPSRVEQVHENMKAADVVDRITPEVLEKINAIFGVKKEDDD